MSRWWCAVSERIEEDRDWPARLQAGEGGRIPSLRRRGTMWRLGALVHRLQAVAFMVVCIVFIWSTCVPGTSSG